MGQVLYEEAAKQQAAGAEGTQNAGGEGPQPGDAESASSGEDAQADAGARPANDEDVVDAEYTVEKDEKA